MHINNRDSRKEERTNTVTARLEDMAKIVEPDFAPADDVSFLDTLNVENFEAKFDFTVTVGRFHLGAELPDGPYLKQTDIDASAYATIILNYNTIPDKAGLTGDAFIMESHTSDHVTAALEAYLIKMAADTAHEVEGATMVVEGGVFKGRPLESATAVEVGDEIVFTVKRCFEFPKVVSWCPIGIGKTASADPAGQYRNSNPIAMESVVVKTCPLGLCALFYHDCCPIPCLCHPFISCCSNGAYMGLGCPLCLTFDDTKNAMYCHVRYLLFFNRFRFYQEDPSAEEKCW